MQLLYIHALKFRHFHNIGFSLRDDYQITQTETELFVRKKSDAVPPYLFCENISSVHAVVGRNAVGKTNLADLIGLTEKQRLAQTNSQWEHALSEEEKEQAYFLLYLPDSSKQPELPEQPELPDNIYYLEVFHRESYQNLFPAFSDRPHRLWDAFWVQLSESGTIQPYEIDRQKDFAAANQTHILLSREKLSQQTFDPDGSSFASFSGDAPSPTFYDTSQSAPRSLAIPGLDRSFFSEGLMASVAKLSYQRDAAMAVSHGTPDKVPAPALPTDEATSAPHPASESSLVFRVAFSTQDTTAASEILAFRNLKKFLPTSAESKTLASLNGTQRNSPPFHDRNYHIAFTWSFKQVPTALFSDAFPELLTPEPLDTFSGQRKLVLYFIAYTLSLSPDYNTPAVFAKLREVFFALVKSFPLTGTPDPITGLILSDKKADEKIIGAFFLSLREIKPLPRELPMNGQAFSYFLTLLSYLTPIKTRSPAAEQDSQNKPFEELPLIVPASTADDRLLNALNQLEWGEFSAVFFRFFHRVWLNISDGEAHFIKNFAALNEHIASTLVRPVLVRGSAILILDEPEVHMHPDLERQYLYLLTHWLHDDFPNMQFQIILLTHSPFLLSDVERSHVLLLQRTPEDVITAKHPENQTFAANIHNILHEPLFLDSPFGSISTELICQVIKQLKKREPENFSPEELEVIISLIGEPLLRNSLYFSLSEYKRTQKLKLKQKHEYKAAPSTEEST